MQEEAMPDPRPYLPLAELENADAMQLGDQLILDVEGYASGFDGSLEMYKSPLTIYPPRFIVYEVPGNTGINPEASPRRLVKMSSAFGGKFNEISVKSKTWARIITPRHVHVHEDAGPRGTLLGFDAEGEAPATRSAEADNIEEANWLAFHDFMPSPSGPELRVSGSVMMPARGWKVSLKEHEPQGINPAVLLLDLVATAPKGNVLPVLTDEKVRFTKKTKFPYRTVHILQINETVEVRDVF
jgi:hypothetical protein